ncbi:MAG: ATP-binding protein [Chitinophagaceae bacterium]
MQVQTDQIIALVVGITFFFLLVAGLLVLYIYVYNNKKKKHIQERTEMQKQFENTLLQSQLEVQEQTRQYIAEELHDNVGALSSLIKINLNLLSQATSEERRVDLIEESKTLVKTMIGDLKQLVIGLNTSVIKNQGFVNAISYEVEHIEKLQLFNISLLVTGEEKALSDDRQIILYRICQELLHNIVKHAQPAKVEMIMTFEKDRLNIRLSDDGIGFDIAEASKKRGASGLTNLQNRARLIGGSLYLNSQPGKGTDCIIQIPL